MLPSQANDWEINANMSWRRQSTLKILHFCLTRERQGIGEASCCRSRMPGENSNDTREDAWGCMECLLLWCDCLAPWSFCCWLLSKVTSGQQNPFLCCLTLDTIDRCYRYMFLELVSQCLNQGLLYGRPQRWKEVFSLIRSSLAA